MNDDPHMDPLPGLPAELAELDAELRDIRLAERSSFGPELQSELERVWREGPVSRSSHGGRRRALAASIGAVLFAGMLVPPARAAIGEISRHSLRLLGVTAERVSVPAPASTGETPLVRNFDLSPVPDRAPALPPGAPASVTTPDGPGPEGPEGDEGEGPPELPRFRPVEMTIPELVDRNADEAAIRRYYPRRLEEEGIGGSVLVQLWVDSAGSVEEPTVIGGSGYPEMDDAAIQAVRELRFRPATRDGRSVGALVQFDLTFEPLPSARRLPTVAPVDRPELPEGLDADFPSLWLDEAVVPAPYQVEARQLLRAALGRPADLERRFGSVENLLEGEPPAGVSPLRWRSAAAAALEDGLIRDPDNPAPYIALGRIRKRQGLRAEALSLFEEGAARAARGSRPVSPRLVAELNYERGLVLKDAWLGVRDLGRMAPDVVATARCAGEPRGASLVDRLIGLNYLCPEEARRVMEEGFRPVEPVDAPRERMLEAFRAAVKAYPAHVGANVELLLDRADEGRWFDMLNEARSFAWASQGDPHALLLSGLALQRLGRPDEAMEEFELAQRVLSDEEVHLLHDIGPLLTGAERKELATLSGTELEGREAAFWVGLDPIRLTDVNERRVEHLARATYAVLRLGGTDTEVGEVWIRYGRPLAVRALGEGTGLRTEFWEYGRGPALTFRRPAVTSEPALTPEAGAYLKDLRASFPHWYGHRSRLVTGLDAQIGRFRALGAEQARVTVDGRVPADLATGPGDTLQVGMFVTGPDGEVVSEVRRTVPAVESVIRMDAPVPERAERFLLELYHPDLGRAAVARSRVARTGSEGEDPRISDLVITEPATPLTRDIRRGESWLIPRPDREDATGDAVGLLFELYDPRPDPYRLSVELTRRDAPGAIAVPIRPAGEDRFGVEWPRTPVDAPEFVTLDLSDVGPGSYTLRLLVDRPGAGASIVAERTILRR